MKKWGLIWLAGIAFTAGGCATPLYKPARYALAPDKHGPIPLATERQVYICPLIERLNPEAKLRLAKDFSVAAWLTDALEQEIAAAGVQWQRAPFECVPHLDELRKTISELPERDDNSVLVTGEILWFSEEKVSMDIVVFSAKGEILFQKRAFCLMHSGGNTVTYMALRQILADPGFRKLFS